MLDRLFTGGESRAISYQSIWGAGDSYAFTTNAGTVITQENALKLGTVYACVRLISDSISTLPVDTYRTVDGERQPVRPRPIWLDYPDSGVTRTDHFQEVLVSMLLDGNAFIRILRDDNGVVGLTVLNPLRVDVTRDPSRRIIYTLRDTNSAAIMAEDMIHISEMRLPGELRGRSRIDLVKEKDRKSVV